jgi:hypothetical protein
MSYHVNLVSTVPEESAFALSMLECEHGGKISHTTVIIYATGYGRKVCSCAADVT